MDTDNSTSTMITMMMTPYFHFTSGDALFFKSWAPSTPGAVAGAAIGLLVLAVLERWFAAMRRVLQAYWRNRARSDDKEAAGVRGAHLVRGGLVALHQVLHYALMLAVMTFQAAFIIAIILGAGLGEIVFGRFGEEGH